MASCGRASATRASCNWPSSLSSDQWDKHTQQADLDLSYLRRAVALALAAERDGNLPIGAVITLQAEVIAEAGNALLVPVYHPGRHAEIEALSRVPAQLWPRAREFTCYTTLEPCVMCCGTLLLHGVGRVVFGASDPEGGAGVVLQNLPPYYADKSLIPAWLGPLLPDLCAPLYERVHARFDVLPCGKEHKTVHHEW